MSDFGKGSEESPLTSLGVAAKSVEILHQGLNEWHREMAEGRDVDESTLGDAVDVDALLCEPERLFRRPMGRAGQEFTWGRYRESFLPRLIGEVEKELAGAVNTARVTPTVIGAKGDLDERTRMFGELLGTDGACVCISVTGDLFDFLVTGNSHAASISVFVNMPDTQLYAATVMKHSALMANASLAHRLTSSGEWVQMAGEPLVPDPEPGSFILPESLVRLEDELHDSGYTKIKIVPDESITPAIIEAVLEHAVPAAIHSPEHVLNSAIAQVARGHGMAVRLYGPGRRSLTPSQTSQMIREAATTGLPNLSGLIIARDSLAAQRIGRIIDRS
ncbi:hypothetical protein IQ62_20830 [Streptomyces scabiei]|uniref:hypothetical protein n=1 Tax=Streptomyces scabiei TaxID=1930 RepID=UPI0004E68FD7|nr:hypothetical protein [Streptomyces scabiei]KFF99129.1 hypothetical protein IQ62_20830 [Streptomyces scabiei]